MGQWHEFAKVEHFAEPMTLALKLPGFYRLFLGGGHAPVAPGPD